MIGEVIPPVYHGPFYPETSLLIPPKWPSTLFQSSKKRSSKIIGTSSDESIHLVGRENDQKRFDEILESNHSNYHHHHHNMNRHSHRHRRKEQSKDYSKESRRSQKFDENHLRSRSASPTKLNIKHTSGTTDRSKVRNSGRSYHRRSSSNDLIFIERRRNNGGNRNIPPDYEYKGKIKVRNKEKRIHRSTIGGYGPSELINAPHFQHTSGSFVIPPPVPPPNIGFEEHVYAEGGGFQNIQFPSGGICGDDMPLPPPNIPMQALPTTQYNWDDFRYAENATMREDIQGSYGGNFPPIPPGAKIIAEYVKELDENYYVPPPPQPPPPPPPFPPMYVPNISEGFEEEYISQPTVIEIWQKSRRRSSSSKEYVKDTVTKENLESVKNDILNVITKAPKLIVYKQMDKYTQKSNEIKRLEVTTSKDEYREPKPQYWTGRDNGAQTEIHGKELYFKAYNSERGVQSEYVEVERVSPHPHITTPTEKDIKVIVQPIQPVFYMPRGSSAGPSQPAQPPVVYIPRNVYVPVIKPVFVPRERVIVRPQIVHVARPVVVDRPIPVNQRPIVIDRERPVPYPVHTSVERPFEVSRQEYIYRDNLPLAYGGRTGEFAAGLNYGYLPTEEQYQYIVSGESGTSQIQQEYGYDYETQNTISAKQYMNYSDVDCFDQIAREEAASHYGTQFVNGMGQGFQGPSYSMSNYRTETDVELEAREIRPIFSAVNIGEDNKNALIETLKKAGTGCSNLEVLDPTVNPGWEPVDARVLIQRYGKPAIQFVQTGVRYGYSLSPTNQLRKSSSFGSSMTQSSFPMEGEHHGHYFHSSTVRGGIVESEADRQD